MFTSNFYNSSLLICLLLDRFYYYNRHTFLHEDVYTTAFNEAYSSISIENIRNDIKKREIKTPRKFLSFSYFFLSKKLGNGLRKSASYSKG